MKTKQKRVADRLRRERERQTKQRLADALSNLRASENTVTNYRTTLADVRQERDTLTAQKRQLASDLETAKRDLERSQLEHGETGRLYRQVSNDALEQGSRITLLTDTVARLEKDNDVLREQLEKKLPAVTRISMHGVEVRIESKDAER